ncbi:GNAT family N-acetyltransferase [Collinsella sp. An2]|uniref:GNAT family N-acetyltransferase n=1 Tax=Collinsella sp. An2 TaxID=1965585 RepID=UPI000B37F199|nr:GNAT family N-acetyltransferase [Collinsella sp. An2]OUP09148.1 GNAT family N-acetyltransferase [Collinsella sp. An2]
MTDTLTMRRALPEEATRVLEILEDGKRSIARFGIEQWQCGYPNLDSVQGDLAQNACYVAVDHEGELVGTLALRLDVDPEYSIANIPWLTPNPTEEPVPYAAIHRCATAASALKRGVMGFLFAAAEDVARGAGRQSIRIDTHPGNLAMRGFLERNGFTELGRFELATKGDQETDVVRIGYEKLL